jgi:hypothetical protein
MRNAWINDLNCSDAEKKYLLAKANEGLLLASDYIHYLQPKMTVKKP